jgi:ABC-type transporter Mla subunit MlaD
LLEANIGAVEEYSEATVTGDKRQQDAALAHLASNADEIADFLSHLNPYLQKDIVRSLIATHGAHHVLQINQYKTKDYAPLGATWPMMRQHVYVIADTMTMALAKQFPSKFS